MNTFDVIIIGGGPAGMSAALILGRARRRVLIVDSGSPRNASSQAINGYLTRDGVSPRDFREAALAELARYGTTTKKSRAVSATALQDVQPRRPAFEVVIESGERYRARKVLIATGVVDVIPEIERFSDYYGKGVHHCPYCDGWEYRDKVIATMGEGNAALNLALTLRTWSAQVTAFTQGVVPSAQLAERAERHGIAVDTRRVRQLAGQEHLQSIRLEDGSDHPCDALFFAADKVQRSSLPSMLGCEFTEEETVQARGAQRTNVPGVFIAGDADGDVQFVIVAAAEGATAAVAINHDLQAEDDLSSEKNYQLGDSFAEEIFVN